MTAEERRNKITQMLEGATKPISATRIAQEMGVSRQIIVQDVAILRAAGVSIVAMARGYLLEGNDPCRRVFKVRHSDESVETELNLIVDAGGTVVDVFVFHKVYGEIRAKLGIGSKDQILDFLTNITSGKSSLLSHVTGGYHYHTVSAGSEKALDLIEARLREHGFLAPRQEFEPQGVMFFGSNN